MKKTDTDKLLAQILRAHTDNPEGLIFHIQEAVRKDRAVLGALINLLSRIANVTPKVNGKEIAIPDFAYFKPTRVTNLNMMLDKISDRKLSGLIG